MSDHAATTRRSVLPIIAVVAGFVAVAWVPAGYAQSPKRDVTLRLDWLYPGAECRLHGRAGQGLLRRGRPQRRRSGPGKGSGSTAQLVASKAAQFGFADGFVVGNSVSKGMNIRWSAAIYRAQSDRGRRARGFRHQDAEGPRRQDHRHPDRAPPSSSSGRPSSKAATSTPARSASPISIRPAAPRRWSPARCRRSPAMRRARCRASRSAATRRRASSGTPTAASPR